MSDGERRSSLIDSQFPVESRPLAGPHPALALSAVRDYITTGVVSGERERAMEHILSEWLMRVWRVAISCLLSAQVGRDDDTTWHYSFLLLVYRPPPPVLYIAAGQLSFVSHHATGD